jgi:putative transposase
VLTASGVRTKCGQLVRPADKRQRNAAKSRARCDGKQSAQRIRVTLPRPIYPKTVSMITRRCAQRQCLLHPDPEMVNAFIYCLAVAAKRYQIDILDFTQLSNHLHYIIYDRFGNAPDFTQYFHRLLACFVNKLRGREESVFASAQPDVVLIGTTEDLISRLVYVATNPIKHGLVATVDEWPGASGHRALLEDRTIHASRPKHFFSSEGDLPEEVTLRVGVPQDFGDRDEILAALKQRVEDYQRAMAAERKRNNRQVLGRAAVLRQHWSHVPSSKPQRTPRRRFASVCRLTLKKLLDRHADFLVAHRAARLALFEGSPIPFPFGTYWLRRYVGVQVQASVLQASRDWVRVA